MVALPASAITGLLVLGCYVPEVRAFTIFVMCTTRIRQTKQRCLMNTSD